MATVITQISTPLTDDKTMMGIVTPPSSLATDSSGNQTSENLVCVLEEFIKQKAREVLNSDQSWDGKGNTINEMDEGFQINGIALGTNWDSDAVPATAVIPKQEFTGSCQESKLMRGSPPSASGPSTPLDNSSSYSVSNMLESLRSNLSQMYSGDPTDIPHYNIKTETPVRGPDYCCNESTFNQLRGQHQQQHQQHRTERDDTTFDNIYHQTSLPSSAQAATIQRQFSCNPYDTTNVIGNPLFTSQQQSYPNYSVKPEPLSPSSSAYHHNNFYLNNNNSQGTAASYPVTSVNQSNYQGYRLPEMIVPSFGNTQNLIKQEKYPTLTTDLSPHTALNSNSTSSNCSGGNNSGGGVVDHKLHQYHRRAASDGNHGPVRVRRLKRPIPAGPSYPVHLWQFILELLGNHSCKDFITWTGNDLEFKVLNSGVLAKRWGRRKNNSRMNFDKLSRAMRYYYEKNIIKHIPGQRLLYTFCRNPDDIVFTELLKTAMGTLPLETRLIAPVTISPHLTPLQMGLTGARFHSPAAMEGQSHALPFPVSQSSCVPSLLQQPIQDAMQHHSNHISNHKTLNHSSPSAMNSGGMLGQHSSLHSPVTSSSPSSIQLGTSQPPSVGLVTPHTTLISPLDGLFTASDDSLSEYMFSTNCLTQVQCHLSSDEAATKHHMMAS